MEAQISKVGKFRVGGPFEYKGLVYQIDSFPNIHTVTGHIDEHVDGGPAIIRIDISFIEEVK